VRRKEELQVAVRRPADGQSDPGPTGYKLRMKNTIIIIIIIIIIAMEGDLRAVYQQYLIRHCKQSIIQQQLANVHCVTSLRRQQAALYQAAQYWQKNST
jgi:hypothetical protein